MRERMGNYGGALPVYCTCASCTISLGGLTPACPSVVYAVSVSVSYFFMYRENGRQGMKIKKTAYVMVF